MCPFGFQKQNTGPILNIFTWVQMYSSHLLQTIVCISKFILLGVLLILNY